MLRKPTTGVTQTEVDQLELAFACFDLLTALGHHFFWRADIKIDIVGFRSLAANPGAVSHNSKRGWTAQSTRRRCASSACGRKSSRRRRWSEVSLRACDDLSSHLQRPPAGINNPFAAGIPPMDEDGESGAAPHTRRFSVTSFNTPADRHFAKDLEAVVGAVQRPREHAVAEAIRRHQTSHREVRAS